MTFISTTPPAKRLPKQLGNVRRFEHITHDHPTSMEVGGAAGCEAQLAEQFALSLKKLDLLKAGVWTLLCTHLHVLLLRLGVVLATRCV